MNKGRNIAILMACLLVLSLLTLLTRSFGGNDTAVVDNVRYVRDSDALSTVTLYEFYFVGTEVMEGDLEQLDDGRYRFTLRYRIPIERNEDEIDIDQNDELPDYTLEPYGYTYYLTGDSEKTAEVTWEYAEGFGPEFGEQPWERFSPKVFKTMIFGRKPPLTIPQALLVAAIAARGGKAPVLGKLDVTMYRDDIGLRRTLPLIRETVIPFNLEGAKVILVDDVLSSGRTIRAALDALTSYGRPALIRLAVLIDRNHPEYPIRPDYVGMRIELPADRKIVVSLPEDPAAATAYTKPASPPEA